MYLMYSIVLLLRLNLFGMLYCRMNSEKWLMAGKQNKIYFTPDFLFKLALEWNISKRSFHQLRLDQGLWPQTTDCHPAGFSYQLVQWGCQILAGLGGQRVFCSVVLLFLPMLHTAAPSPPSNVSTVEVTSEETQQMKWDLSELIKVTLCCRTVPASPGGKPRTSLYSSALLPVCGSSAEQWNGWPWRKLDNGREQWIVNIFMRTQGVSPLGFVESKQSIWQKRISWELFKRIFGCLW